MKLFESTWRDGYEYYERYYDDQLNRSIKRRVDLPCEWYEPSSRGLYTYILDKTIKLEKKQGRAKEGRDSYGFLDPMYRNIRDNYWNKNAYNLNPRIWALDIETRSTNGFPVPEKADQTITLIQIYDNKLDTMFVFGLRDWKHQSDYSFSYKVEYIKCNDEIELLDSFLDLFKKLDPLMIFGWYTRGFDYPYIHNRLKNLGMDVNRLSNYGKVSYSEHEFQGKQEFSFTSDGHFFLDLQEVYQNFIKAPRPSYSLDAIAEIDLKENKVKHSEYNAFDDFYTGKYIIPDNPTEEQKNSKIYQAAIAGDLEEVKELSHSEFVYYGITDTYLVKRIEENKNLAALMIMISEKMGVQISDSMGTVKPWSQYILNKSMLNNQVMPPKQEHGNPTVVGGFVRDSIKGKHRWVISADVNSMYPLLGMTGFNMSPETFIPIHKLPGDLRDLVLTYFNDQDELRRLNMDKEIWDEVTELITKYNYSLGINGAVFDKSKLGMIPEMVLEIYASRKKDKKTQFKYEQQKVLIKHILKERKNG